MSIQQALDLAVQHHQAGNFPQAEQIYRQVLQADPNNAVALHLLGLIAHQFGRSDLAIAWISQAVRLLPDFAEAHSNLGIILLEQGELASAQEHFNIALRRNPQFAQAHNNLGNCFRKQGNLAEAISSYRQALAINPNFPEAHNNLGITFEEQGRFEDAVSSVRRALALMPNYPEAHNNLGNALHKLGRVDEALASMRESLRLNPRFAPAHYNLGFMLSEQGKLDEAEASLREALRLKPDYAEAHNNLGIVREAQNRSAVAVANYEDALRLRPDFIDAHYNLAQVLLRLGNWQRGWAEYEWRARRPELLGAALPQPMWQGEPLNGRTILLRAEQGQGDTVQFIRFARQVKQRGAGKVYLVCQPSLVRLLRNCPGVDQVFARGDPTQPLPYFDIHMLLLSLPHRLGIVSPEQLQAEPSYLDAEPTLVAEWRARLQGVPGMKVGIHWQGNPDHRADRLRSVPIEHFASLTTVPGVSLVSLQKGPGSEQLARLPGVAFDAGPYLTDFAQTAGLLKNLDLTITVDTAVAHLAGALGVPVWAALPYAVDWRWLLERSDSPWYPSIRLFRQPRAGAWEEVFDRIRSDVSAWCKSP